ncbi:hypothetical protein CONPUDRAFT_65876 [Coniophora puteana RWD-64-598 SS2]|uniref:C2H2-type domain-containing protein n=1 Tax=Coniophora puteana (strain RWD-64-598) TaxID=741705 RepID=A0A5M3M9C5_CONPW|nr:uncharacterized protein CONPUDRAFT_65876 [Coniophora puteana RWD-64-598 SS2]EIW75687.1 hypothetical protein CONPUDRAFT_65876 [Coniophora puteana RWD-64-598 SS2]
MPSKSSTKSKSQRQTKGSKARILDQRYTCPAEGCSRICRNTAGLTQHFRSQHTGDIQDFYYHQPAPPSPLLPHAPPSRSPSPSGFSLRPSSPLFDPYNDDDPMVGDAVKVGRLTRYFHKFLTGQKCSSTGEFLPPGTPPSPPSNCDTDDWHPFGSRLKFETADFLFRNVQMSADHINFLCRLWAMSLVKHNDNPPFRDHTDLYDTIDASKLGEIPWRSFSVKYNGPKPARSIPPWMGAEYDVWFRDPHLVVKNILARPDFKSELDYTPYRDYDENGVRQYENLFSGDWAWEQADIISQDPATHGSTFVLVILGSDKTTVSVATGLTEYYPLYLSIGNVHNNTRRARRNAVVLIGFLSIPKTNKTFSGDPNFRKFRRQLYHASLSSILQSLKPYMTKYEVVPFGDGYHRRVIYGIGPYIADYPEQVLLAGIVQGWCPRCLAFPDDLDTQSMQRTRHHNETLVQELPPGVLWDEYGTIADVVPFTNDFPRADIHDLIAPDILHQLIKGTFKDHLVDWVEQYLEKTHGKARAAQILDDIDRRIAVAAPFAGLRRFPQGRGFKQWTGDDSKALMKVYLPAIENHVPPDVVRAFRAFLEFCYYVRRNVITEKDFDDMDNALARFHRYRKVFVDSGVSMTLSLPRQHSLVHYKYLIRRFGAPNGLCSSITESKHIEAVKDPWRRSSRFNALGQMLTTNSRLDKLAACRVDFDARGMLHGDGLEKELALLEEGIRGAYYHSFPCSPSFLTTSARKRARTLPDLAQEIGAPTIIEETRRFLFSALRAHDPRLKYNIHIPIEECPRAPMKITVVNSAVSTFRAPSDNCGTGGLKRERIRSTPSWRNEAPRQDCAFLLTNESLPGTLSMDVARILAFFKFNLQGTVYECAVVHWYEYYSNERDDLTGMYIVQPMYRRDGTRHTAVVDVDTMVRGCHLLPVFGKDPVPEDMTCHQSYDSFDGYYINRFIDHHAFELA